MLQPRHVHGPNGGRQIPLTISILGIYWDNGKENGNYYSLHMTRVSRGTHIEIPANEVTELSGSGLVWRKRHHGWCVGLSNKVV